MEYIKKGILISELLTTKSRKLHKITEKVSYLLRSLILKSLFFLVSPQ
nr:MAG TPA: hypothetical protein [Caudoviricetes sp.]